MKIIRIIFGVILFLVALAFVIIEGRLLFSGDWLLHEVPFFAFLRYFARFSLALGVAVSVNNNKSLVLVGKDENGNDLPKTIISKEYSSEWKPGDEPYYPVNDEKNTELYQKYRELADKEDKVIFGGRLGEYKYYDMDAVIASALDLTKKELG